MKGEQELDAIIALAAEKASSSEGSSERESALTYGNPNALQFKRQTYVPYDKFIRESFEKFANQPVADTTFGKTAIGGPVTGLAQGAANTIGSMLNVPLGWFNKYTEPVDLSDTLNYESGPEGIANRYGYQLGNIAGGIAPELASYFAGSHLLKGIPGLTGLGARTAFGAGTGYAGGQYGLGGRTGGAIMGGLGSIAGESSSPRIAGRMEAQIEKEAARLAPQYEKTIGKAKHVEFPYASDDMWDLIKPKSDYHLSDKASEIAHEYAKTGDPFKAKKVISEFKRERDALKTKEFPTAEKMVGARKRKYEKLDRSIKAIEQEFEEAYASQGLFDEFSKYKELDKEFKSKVGPYKFPELENYIEGYSSSAKPVPEAVRGMKKFSEKLPSGLNEYEYLIKKNPEILINALMPELTPERLLMGAMLKGQFMPYPVSITSQGVD